MANRKFRRRPDGAGLQLSAIVRRPKGVQITRDVLYAAFERWLDGESTPGIRFRLTLWDGREMSEPPEQTERWIHLSESIRRLLREGRIPLRKMGKNP